MLCNHLLQANVQNEYLLNYVPDVLGKFFVFSYVVCSPNFFELLDKMRTICVLDL